MTFQHGKNINSPIVSFVVLASYRGRQYTWLTRRLKRGRKLVTGAPTAASRKSVYPRKIIMPTHRWECIVDKVQEVGRVVMKKNGKIATRTLVSAQASPSHKKSRAPWPTIHTLRLNFWWLNFGRLHPNGLRGLHLKLLLGVPHGRTAPWHAEFICRYRLRN